MMFFDKYFLTKAAVVISKVKKIYIYYHFTCNIKKYVVKYNYLTGNLLKRR